VKQSWLTALGLTLVAAAAGAADFTAQDLERLKLDTRQKAMPVLPQVVGMATAEVQQRGAAQAIPVCKEKAPQALQRKAEETGWRLSRVSLKTRNPERGRPDAWEARHLAEFNIRSAQGEKPEALEVGEVVTDGQGKQEFRYLRAIPVGPFCVQCHGVGEQVAQDLRASLARDYPHDQALGYSVGQIRGALSVRRPL
jgi:hypothetical protein